MPLSKAKLFDEYYQSIALTGRALAHPARVQIIDLLSQYQQCKNVELTGVLGLSVASINNHVKKLEEAGIVEVVYADNYMQIRLNPVALNGAEQFIRSQLGAAG